jgi:glycosyltransferase involved in cell wall biosynthesis
MVKDRLSVLYTSPILRHPPVGGPYLRVENSIKALSEVCDLHIYARVSLGRLGGTDALAFYRRYCRDLALAPRPGIARRAANLLARRALDRNVFDVDSRAVCRGLLRIAAGVGADIIWLGYGNISYPLLRYIKTHSTYRVVLDTDSVWSRYILRKLPYARHATERRAIANAGRRKEEEEREGTRLADVTTAVSEVDAEYYRRLAGDPDRVHIFSNVIDLHAYAEPPAPPDRLRRPALYLAGTFARGNPMDHAARWLIDTVLPRVRRELPDVHLYIAGVGSRSALADVRDPGTTVLGEVASVLPYLCHADAALVPLHFESGTRFKILEAGACGVPVVSTTLGAEGLAVRDGRHVLIAEQPDAFARGIVRLIREPELARELAMNLEALVRAQHGIASLTREATRVLHGAMVGASR